MSVAVIERTEARLMNGPPLVLVNERAALECGCAMWVGLRVDKHEAVSVATPCSSDHEKLVERANAALRASLENPTDRPLIDVCAEILTAAAEVPS